MQPEVNVNSTGEDVHDACNTLLCGICAAANLLAMRLSQGRRVWRCREGLPAWYGMS